MCASMVEQCHLLYRLSIENTLPIVYTHHTLPYHKSPDFLSRGSNDNFTQGGFFFPIAYRANKIRYVE